MSAPPSIVTQPANQSVPMGLQASFSVVANGSALQYQWSKDGTPIAGAISSTYTTPPTVFVDSGSSFTVTASDADGSVTSNPAALSVTARAPKAGDLRFQQVDAVSTVNGYTGDYSSSNVLGTPLGYTFSNAIGTPLWIGYCGGVCVWQFYPWPLPAGVTGLNMAYYDDLLEEMQDDLNGTGAFSDCTTKPNTVVTSISLSPYRDEFAISCIQTSQNGGFDVAQNTVDPSDFQAAATQEGEHSRVITAVSYDANGKIFYFSYGWQGDTTTAYETQVATATIETATAAVMNLANQGYILTATGAQDNSDNVVLVGTRVKGDTMPRPTAVITLAQETASPSTFLNPLEQGGYAVVGVFFEHNNTLTYRDWIGER